jgi:hypothetical protein
MAVVDATVSYPDDRTMRRLECLARFSAGRRTMQRRTQTVDTALEVLMRRAERGASARR